MVPAISKVLIFQQKVLKINGLLIMLIERIPGAPLSFLLLCHSKSCDRLSWGQGVTCASIFCGESSRLHCMRLRTWDLDDTLTIKSEPIRWKPSLMIWTQWTINTTFTQEKAPNDRLPECPDRLHIGKTKQPLHCIWPSTEKPTPRDRVLW